MRNRLKILRQQREMTQVELAKVAHVSQATISTIERERYTPRVDVAMYIAHALNVTVEDIFVIREQRR